MTPTGQTPAADPVAAELAAIRDHQENGDLRDFAFRDSPRLLAAAEHALAAASDWQATQGDTPAHEATRSCGRQLREVLERDLAGGER